MRVLQRVEEIRGSEHARLRVTLQLAARGIEDLKATQVGALTAPSKVDMFGDPVARERAQAAAEADPVRRVNMGPMLKVWTPFESMLLERVNTWEMDLWPLVQRWAMGEPVAESVQAVASGMVARRRKLEPLLRDMRVQASFVGQLRAPMVAVFAAIEAADAVEAEVVPTLIAGRAELRPASLEGTTPITMSSESVTRNLRSQTRAPRPEAQPRRPSKSSLASRLASLFKFT